MSNATAPHVPSPEKMDPSGAFLSFVVPGLGQILQGRIGKGLLFFVGVYSLFFYGQFLGQWQNVYFGDTASEAQKNWSWPRLLVNLYNRPQYAGQFWVGAAAWPAAYHYWADPPTESPQHRNAIAQPEKMNWLQRTQYAIPEDRLNELQRDGDKRWDLGWVYTVIAGVLNVLVIYDALAGPAFGRDGKGKPA
ncbi:MAG: hypothetical protein K1X57_07570 [Gemmataceae bacterium]|nr:hypothetical protein [Gemmataceae bacterium]